MSPGLRDLHLEPGVPDLTSLPWHLPLAAWRERCPWVVEVPRGLSRHEVLFVLLGKRIFAVKELPEGLAAREFALLRRLEEADLPAVRPAGHALAETEAGPASLLVTRYLEASLPYRMLFENPGLERYRDRLLDAVADLLVRLHLAGFWWGDFSLSNALFRRDAGQLQAYLVDAETGAWYPRLSDGQRSYDLDILEEHVAGDLMDVAASLGLPPGRDREALGHPDQTEPDERTFDVFGTGPQLRARYERLWGEATEEVLIGPGEAWRVQERLERLKRLGFSVGEVELEALGDASRLRVRTIVTDRDYHRHVLQNLTGLVAEERQATLMLDEIHELRASLSRQQGAADARSAAAGSAAGPSWSVPLQVAAHRWRQERYEPAARRLATRPPGQATTPELYCEVLEHKWFLSERAGRDVGLERALESFLAGEGAGPPPAD